MQNLPQGNGLKTYFKLKVSNDTIRSGINQIYNERIHHLEEEDRPTQILIYGSCRLQAELFGRATGSFRKKVRFDRVSVQRITSGKKKGEPYYAELHCLCAIYWRAPRAIENVAVVRWFEDVSEIKEWVFDDKAREDAKALAESHGPLFDQLDYSIPGNGFATDGHLRLGRRYVTYRPRIRGSQPYSIIPISRLYKPEHLLRDRKLIDADKNNLPAWLVQNTKTYYTNLPMHVKIYKN